MTDNARKHTAHLQDVIALIWSDATGFVRFRLVVALLLIMVAVILWLLVLRHISAASRRA